MTNTGYNLNELKIELTHKCPLACIHCSSNASIQNCDTLTYHKCEEIVTQAIKLGIKKIAFSGGEPLIWNNLKEIIELVHNNNIHSTIYTSGYIDNEQEVFYNLSKAGLDRAIFSIYSNNEQEHIRITRKKDSFKKTINSINACKKNNIEVEIHFVALANNYSKIRDVSIFAKSIGVDTISILRFVPQGRGRIFKKDEVMNKKQNLELIKLINDLRNSGFTIRTGSPFNVFHINSNPKCYAAQDRMIVTPDLRIYPCDAFKNISAEQITGNTNYSTLESNSLEDCWTKSEYLNTVRNAVNNLPTSPCNKCNDYNSCLSGCLAQKYLEYSSLCINPDPLCLKLKGE